MVKLNIGKEAQRYRDLFEHKERGEGDNKEGFYCFNTTNGKDYDRISDIMHKIDTSEDFLYEQVVYCLDWVIENKDKSIDELQDDMYEAIDGNIDVYTANLTAWLADNINNVYYLTEALQDGCEDGFALLTQAQGKAIQEIWSSILQLFNE